jgi:hypothetical protein
MTQGKPSTTATLRMRVFALSVACYRQREADEVEAHELGQAARDYGEGWLAFTPSLR